jgi:hypothetical protein
MSKELHQRQSYFDGALGYLNQHLHSHLHHSVIAHTLPMVYAYINIHLHPNLPTHLKYPLNIDKKGSDCKADFVTDKKKPNVLS